MSAALAVVCPECGDYIDLSLEPLVDAIAAMFDIAANACWDCGVVRAAGVPECVPAGWA